MTRAEDPSRQGQWEVTKKKSCVLDFGTQVSARTQHSSHTSRGVTIIERVTYPCDTSMESKLRTVQKRPEILATVRMGEEQCKKAYNSTG